MLSPFLVVLCSARYAGFGKTQIREDAPPELLFVVVNEFVKYLTLSIIPDYNGNEKYFAC